MRNLLNQLLGRRRRETIPLQNSNRLVFHFSPDMGETSLCGKKGRSVDRMTNIRKFVTCRECKNQLRHPEGRFQG